MENLTEGNIEHWDTMAEQTITKIEKINRDRDDWGLHKELQTLEKFRTRLRKRKVTVRLFAAAQQHIQFTHSGRINKESSLHHLHRQTADPDQNIII